MSGINELFFDLIRVSIGTQETLSRVPSTKEWEELYKMAQKQSLIGICFAGVQKLYDNDNQIPRTQNSQPDIIQNQEPRTQNLDEVQYLTWMGMTAQIQKRNEMVNQQCVELQNRISAEGLRSCILKGQGVASLYKCGGLKGSSCSNGCDLRGFRQSGDIDLWVDAPKKDVVDWVKKVGMTEKPGYLHVGASCFDDTSVELHYRPTYLRSFRHNKRVQKFCKSHKADWTERNGMIVPSWEFDVVYQLSHIYRHLFGMGVGLRQLMDYYFGLRSLNLNTNLDSNQNESLKRTLSSLGLYNFAGAVMYVMREVFGLDKQYMICPVDEKRGQMLLRQVMQTGNFGHLDEKQKAARNTTVGSVKYKLRQWWELLKFYPEETLSAPLWSMRMHFN